MYIKAQYLIKPCCSVMEREFNTLDFEIKICNKKACVVFQEDFGGGRMITECPFCGAEIEVELKHD